MDVDSGQTLAHRRWAMEASWVSISSGSRPTVVGITSGHARRAVATRSNSNKSNLTYEVHRTDWSTPPTSRRGLMHLKLDQASCVVL